MDFNCIDLYRALFNDLGVDEYTQSYVLNRLSNEGLSVATVLLPSFAKHVIHCVEQGYWSDFSTSVRKKGGLPTIFRVNLMELFHYDLSLKKWVVNSVVDPVSLWVIRQACEYTYKLALPFSNDQLKKAEESFLECESTVLTRNEFDCKFVDSMRRNFETHYPRTFKIDLANIASNARPGPGTFSGSEKDWYFRRYRQITIPSAASALGHGQRFNKRSPRPIVDDSDPGYSEVLFVPKDSRGPRVISREPFNVLQFQMGFNTSVSSALERDTRNRINFNDQEINRSLAQSSSITRSYATLDLKDASDRVSFDLVRHILRYSPLLGTLKFRTPFAKLRNGKVLKLKKLSGMGSGYTFPMMALIIHLAICTHVSHKLRLNYQNVMNHVYVFGDDIIVPTPWYELACEALYFAGLTVNSTKSFRSSFFRESCGGDYYYGNDVTPVRLKLANSGLKANGVVLCSNNYDFFILGLERHARELVKKQLHSASDYIYRYLESKLGKLPYVSGGSPILGRYTDRDRVLSNLLQDETGLHKDVRVWVVRPIKDVMHDMCPYRYLLHKLGKAADVQKWYDHLWFDGSQIEYGTLDVPRKIKLTRKKVSSFALT